MKKLAITLAVVLAVSQGMQASEGWAVVREHAEGRQSQVQPAQTLKGRAQELGRQAGARVREEAEKIGQQIQQEATAAAEQLVTEGAQRAAEAIKAGLPKLGREIMKVYKKFKYKHILKRLARNLDLQGRTNISDRLRAKLRGDEARFREALRKLEIKYPQLEILREGASIGDPEIAHGQ